MKAKVGVTLTALGDGTRRRVVEELSGGERSAGELAAALAMTPAALTRHLRVLRQAGVVGVSLDDGDNRRHVYTLRAEPLRELRDWADEVAAFWVRQLAAYGEHVDGR